MAKVDWITWKTSSKEIINPNIIVENIQNSYSEYNEYMNPLVYDQIKNELDNGILAKDKLSITGNTPLNKIACDIINKIDAKGTVEFKNSSSIYPHETKKIKKVNFKIGDEVKKGDVLAEYDVNNLDELKRQLNEAKINLDTAKISLATLKLPASNSELSQIESQIILADKNINDLKSQVKQYDISIEQINRDINDAKIKYENNKLLYEHGGLAKNDLDNSNENLKKLEDKLNTTQTQMQVALESINTAQKNYDLLDAQYNDLKNKLSDQKVKNQISQQELQISQINLKIKDLNKKINEFETKEISPINGKIVELNAVEGDIASENKYLFKIANTDLSNLIVNINVPENSTKGIDLGQKVELITESSKEISIGQISKIYPAAQEKQIKTSKETVLVVEAEIIEPKADFKKGYNIEANIISAEHNDVLIIPLVATISEDNQDYVYVIDDNSVVHKKNIAIKLNSDLYVEAEGLEEGQKIILNPSNKIKDGMKIKEIKESQVKK